MSLLSASQTAPSPVPAELERKVGRGPDASSRGRIFVLIDALGWECLKNKPFLADILPYRTPVRTVLGFSSGAIPAILTGLAPQSNGHWNLYYYDPEHSPFRWLNAFCWIPDRLLNTRYTRKLIKETGRRVLGLGPGFDCQVPVRLLPYFNFSEKRNIYEPGGLSGAQSVFDLLREKQVPFRAYSYHRYSDAEIFREAMRDLRARRFAFYFLYLAEMDGFLHAHCSESGNVQQKLDAYARELRRLYGLARQSYDDFSFCVFSDHGMTPIRASYDLLADIEKFGFRVPKDYLAVLDSTMARFWFFRPEVRARFQETLTQLPCGRILSDDDLRALGLFFPDRRYGELIFLMNPGTLIARNHFSTQWQPAGMHGFHPDDVWSDAVFLSREPPPRPVRTIVDIYAVMTEGIS